MSGRDAKFYRSYSTNTPAALMSAKRKSSIPRKAGATAAAIDSARRESADFLRSQEEAEKAKAAVSAALEGGEGDEHDEEEDSRARLQSAYVPDDAIFNTGPAHKAFGACVCCCCCCCCCTMRVVVVVVFLWCFFGAVLRFHYFQIPPPLYIKDFSLTLSLSDSVSLFYAVPQTTLCCRKKKKGSRSARSLAAPRVPCSLREVP
jgi:hypothetical protein